MTDLDSRARSLGLGNSQHSVLRLLYTVRPMNPTFREGVDSSVVASRGERTPSAIAIDRMRAASVGGAGSIAVK
jgi:hypothetical protein